MLEEELCPMKIYEREKLKQHSQESKDMGDGANECRDGNCCQ